MSINIPKSKAIVLPLSDLSSHSNKQSSSAEFSDLLNYEKSNLKEQAVLEYDVENSATQESSLLDQVIHSLSNLDQGYKRNLRDFNNIDTNQVNKVGEPKYQDKEVTNNLNSFDSSRTNNFRQMIGIVNHYKKFTRWATKFTVVNDISQSFVHIVNKFLKM